MRMRLTFFVFVLFILLLNVCPASSQEVTFTRFTPSERISLGFITGMTQDQQGYMWFTGATGLYRYDGYKLTTYLNDPLNSKSLGGNNLECVYADRNGFIWIGTKAVGLDRFDPATGVFTHFVHNPIDPSTLSNNTLTCILQDHEGNLWVGTHGGLDRWDSATGKFLHYHHNANDPNSISCNHVRAIYEDHQGTIWIGTGSPFPNDDGSAPDDGGLNRLDKKTGKFTRYLHDPKNPHSLINNKVRAIFEDSRGTFWVGTAGDGLHTMDRANGLFDRHLYDPAHPDRLSRPALKPSPPYPAYDHISFITEDANGNIWIGTLFSGLNRYDPKTQKVTHFETEKRIGSGFTDNSGWFAYTSREGVLWISTWNGNLFQIYPLQKNIPYISTGSTVIAFNEDVHDVLWVGTANGLIRTDQHTGNTERYVSEPLNTNTLSDNNVFSIYKDYQDLLWIGGSHGLNKFDQKTKTFTRYLHNSKDSSSLSDGIIYAITGDEKGSLWVGTEDGLNLMNKKTNSFIHYRNNPEDSNSLSQTGIICVMKDRSDNLWVGTESGGLNLLDQQSGKFKHFLRGDGIDCIYEDSRNIIWVGTRAGLYSYDQNAKSFSRFVDENPGTKIGTNRINSIVEDDKKNLWVSASSGIFKLSPDRKEITIFSRNHGVNASFLNIFAGYKTKNGKLFFGAGPGYYAFFPDSLTSNTKPPQVVLTDFRIGDESIKPGPKSPLKVPLNQTKEILLNYKQNTFAFEFAGIHFSSPEDNRHIYMLENFDKNWQEANTERTAYYNNLPPGSYIFRVRAQSSDGAWEEKNIKVIITPPWWRTWWAYILFAILFAASVWGFIYYRSRRLVKEKRVLEEKVNIRTAEIVKQKEEIAIQRDNLERTFNELKATQSQLMLREKMASLGELTAGIAHEIQNPLNFVNNFSEISVEFIDEMETELKAGNKDGALEIIKDIRQNLEKIANHGKRADSIVKGMLQHSRSSSGQKELTDINALADEFLRLSFHGLRAKDKSFNATMHTDFDPKIGKMNIIPQDIGRVLLNLYNNAFFSVTAKKKKQGEGFEPIVSVSTKKMDEKVVIKVRDNGMGISQNVLDKIFQPFFTTKPTGEGTGLGLSLSYDIITKGHGGEIKVETKEGEFAEFIILLPLK